MAPSRGISSFAIGSKRSGAVTPNSLTCRKLVSPDASSTSAIPLITCSVLSVTLNSAISTPMSIPPPIPAATPSQGSPL